MQIGETKAGLGKWQLDKDLKTYHGRVEVEGKIANAAAAELSTALNLVIRKNAKLKLGANVRDNLPVSLHL